MAQTSAAESVVLRPHMPLYIVGDIHGTSGLLEALLEKIDADIGAQNLDAPWLIFVGDYIDRGEESAQVLARMQELTTLLPNNVTCLMGNHEKMMLNFLDDPAEHGPRWLRYGGLQTLASYKLRGISGTSSPAQLEQIAEDLCAAMPAGQEAWLRGLPLQVQSGNVAVVHAAASPNRDLQSQPEDILLWGHPEFMTKDRSDDTCVVHGHTVVETPEHAPTRIGVDTGAYYTGKLTAARITPDGALDFLQT